MRYVLTSIIDGEYTETLYRSFDEAVEAEQQLQVEGYETFGIEKI